MVDYDSDGKCLKDGDLIEIERGDLRHWCIYDNGDVIHVATQNDNDIDNHSSGRVGQLADAVRGHVNTIIKREKLDDVIHGSKYYKNNELDCTHQPFEARTVVENARKCIGKQWEYYLFHRNCEHFVTTMRYGKPVSLQVDAVSVTALGCFMGFLLTTVIPLFGELTKKDNDEEDGKK